MAGLVLTWWMLSKVVKDFARSLIVTHCYKYNNLFTVHVQDLQARNQTVL